MPFGLLTNLIDYGLALRPSRISYTGPGKDLVSTSNLISDIICYSLTAFLGFYSTQSGMDMCQFGAKVMGSGKVHTQ